MTHEDMPPPPEGNDNDNVDGDPVFDALEEVSRTMGGDNPLEGVQAVPTEGPDVPVEADTVDPVTQALQALGDDPEGAMDRAMDMNLRIQMLPPALRASMEALRAHPYIPGGLESYVSTAENAAAVLRVYPTADEISSLRSMNEDDLRAAMERLERAGYVFGRGGGLYQACELALWTFGPGQQ